MTRCYDVITPRIRRSEPAVTPMESDDLKCPYCGNKARKTTGKELFPHRPKLAKNRFFWCKPCDARVGCHDVKGHKYVPFGSMANKELRNLRQQAHRAFDPIWKAENRKVNRFEAYGMLAARMGITREECHIGMFNEEQCLKVVEVMKDLADVAIFLKGDRRQY